MKISLDSTKYLRQNVTSTKSWKHGSVLFYNSNNEILGKMLKNNNGDTKYFTTDIFKNGRAFIHKFVKQTFEKIYVAGATVEEDTSVVNRIVTEIVESNYDKGTQRTIKKVVDLETPYKLMEEYPVTAGIYKVDGKIKYSKPQIIEDKIEELKYPWKRKD